MIDLDLGSSDAPAVLGVSSFTTPWMLYAKKVGLLPDETPDTEVMKRGRQMEAAVLDMFLEEVGVAVYDVERSPHTMRWRQERPWQRATPDAIEHGRDGALIEVKCVVGFPPDAPRVEWLVQCIHQRMVYPEIQWQSLVCFGNLQLVWWEIPYHQGARDRVLREEERFLERIVKRDPPPVRAADAAVLGKAWPITTPEPVDLDAYVEIAQQYDAACTAAKKAEEEKDALEAILKQQLGEHEEGVFSDGSRVTWKTHTRKEHTRTVAAGTYRRFARQNGGTHDDE